MNYFFEGADAAIQKRIEQEIDGAKEQALQKDVILKVGKFAGRRARITAITADRYGLMFLARPYRLDGNLEPYGKDRDLLWDHPDARSFRRYTELHFVDYDGEYHE